MHLANRDVKSSAIRSKNLYATHTFNGDRLALIGTGQIGSKVSKMPLGLGIDVYAYSPCFTEEKALDLGVKFCRSLEEALEGAHYIAIQVPLSNEDSLSHPKTVGMIDYKLLSKAAFGAKLINVSRCDVVNLNDLEQLIAEKHISAVSLDILSSEVEKIKKLHPRLFSMEQVIMTPLIACESEKADIAITTISLLKAEKFFTGEICAKDTVNLR